MYIDPFVAGVISTIFVESIALIVIASISISKDKKKGKK